MLSNQRRIFFIGVFYFMAWKTITEKEANSLFFEFDEEAIERGIKDARYAMEAAGLMGPDKQKKALASGKVGLEIVNGKLAFSSAAPEQETYIQWLLSSKEIFAGMTKTQILGEIMNRVKAEDDLYSENIKKLKFSSNAKEKLRLREGETTRHNSVIQELMDLSAEYGIHLQL